MTNDEKPYGKPISNEKLSEVMNRLYNVWFRKWREGKLSDVSFDMAFDEAYYDIIREFDEYPVVSHLFISLIYELDARRHGGYTKSTRNKLLQMIQNEGEGNHENI